MSYLKRSSINRHGRCRCSFAIRYAGRPRVVCDLWHSRSEAARPIGASTYSFLRGDPGGDALRLAIANALWIALSVTVVADTEPSKSAI
jgi:hypothetical protein